MAWILLVAAIAAEVTGTSALKLSDGLTKLLPSVVVAVGYILSFVLLARRSGTCKSASRMRSGPAWAPPP